MAQVKPRKAMRRELTPAQRSEILGAYRMGIKAPQIAAHMWYPPAILYDIIQMSALHEGNKSLPRSCPR
jgi:hypothetical protein